jgi:hypothetical protein
VADAGVVRLCRVRTLTDLDESPFPLDADGFLDTAAAEARVSGELLAGMLVGPDVAADAGALVLLGEPGVGKTTVLRALTDGLSDLEEDPEGAPAVLWLDAADVSDVSFQDRLGRYLASLPNKHQAVEASAEVESGEPEPAVTGWNLTVVLDQLDESPMLSRLAAELRRGLKGRDASRVRWLVACRTSDYPSALTAVLTDAAGGCVLADLAPLTRGEAVKVGAGEDVDGGELISAAIASGAGALASIPLTLKLLAQTFKEQRRLEGTPADLFGHGVRLLVQENDADRWPRVDAVSSVDQRLAVAARIAARMVLSGQRTVWRGVELGANRLDVGAGSLAAGHELTPNGPFEVTPAIVSATLSTALFTGRGEHRLAFRHSSMAAYLTAIYIQTHEVSRAQLTSLFLVAGDDGSTSIPAPLRETVAWLLTLEPRHGQWLISADPQSLAAHSHLVDSPAVRALLVEGLLRRAADIELGDFPWQRHQTRLAHPGLADQLVNVLVDAGRGPPADWSARARTRLAVRLADEASSSALAESLLCLTESDLWDPYERQLAAAAAMHSTPDIAVPRLRALLLKLADVEYGRQVDADDELRGRLLHMLWPDHLTIEEVLPCLRSRTRRSLFGSYAAFLRTMPADVTDSDLPTLLDWATTPPTASLHSSKAAVSADSDAMSQDVHAPRPHRPTHEDTSPSLDKDLLAAIVDRATDWKCIRTHAAQVATILWPRLHSYQSVSIPAPLDVVDKNKIEPAEARDARRRLAWALCERAVLVDAHRGDFWYLLNGWASRLRLPHWPEDEERGHGAAGRSHLLDAGDFTWALNGAQGEADAGRAEMAQALGQIAALVFNADDPDAFELAYSSKQNPAWEHLKWTFEPIELNSDLARTLREDHRVHRSPDKEPWPQAQEFLSGLQAQRDAAERGDTGAFWRLVWGLQFDPRTGQGHPPASCDDPLALPAAEFLEPRLSSRLPDAALAYLTAEHDHWAEWLGGTSYDKRAWAGYQAAALLERLGRIDEVPPQAWKSWVGAFTWFWATSEQDGRDRKRRLLALGARHAPVELAQAVQSFVTGALTRGITPNDLEMLEPRSSEALAATLNGLLTQIASARFVQPTATQPESKPGADVSAEERQDRGSTSPSANERTGLDGWTIPTQLTIPDTSEGRGVAFHTWATLLRLLLTAKDQRATYAAVEAIAEGSRDDARELAVIAAVELLHTDAPTFWPVVEAATQANRGFGRDVARRAAGPFRGIDVSQQLDEAHLAKVFGWLVDLFPSVDDVHHEGAHFIGPDESARRWRDEVLRALGRRGTPAAVAVLTQLTAEMPDRLDIAATLILARGAVHAAMWTPPPPLEVARLIADKTHRLVRSAGELAALLLQTLTDIAEDLPAHSELLWDRAGTRRSRKKTTRDSETEADPLANDNTETWRPKPEAALSAYLAHEFSLRLTGRGLAVNREVLVLPRDAYGAGDRTDILVEATMRHDPYAGTAAAAPARLLVVVEVKGAWNPKLDSDQRTQLVDRYLPEAGTDTGIYVVGWYPVELWTAVRDPRKAAAKKLDRGALDTLLAEQASDLQSQTTRHAHPYILNIPRPHQENAAVG